MASMLHRPEITEALDPDLPMHPFRQRGGAAVLVGLWAAWWNGDHGGPSGLKVVIATVHDPSGIALSAAPGTQALGSLPWLALQFQALNPNDEAWGEISAALATEIEAYQRQDVQSEKRCPGRLAYDPSQEVHSIRKIRKPQSLEEYQLERLPEGQRPAIGPSTVADRTRVAYRVLRGGSTSPEVQPLWVFVERPTPKEKVFGNTESGLNHEGSLLGAVGEWRTWILLANDGQ